MRRYSGHIIHKPSTWLTLFRCDTGHLYFYHHPSCPDCRGRLRPVRSRGEGLLVSHTTIQITPTGESVSLGIVKHKGGAKTLCRIIGETRGNGRDRVSIFQKDGLYYVFGRSKRAKIRR